MSARDRRLTPYSGLLYCGRCDVTLNRAVSRGRPCWRCLLCDMTIAAAPVESTLDARLERTVDDPEQRRVLLRAVIARATVYPAATRGPKFDPARVRIEATA